MRNGDRTFFFPLHKGDYYCLLFSKRSSSSLVVDEAGKHILSVAGIISFMSLNGPFFIDRHVAITRKERVTRGFRVKLFKLEEMFAVVAERTLIAAQQQKIV